ncbi:MAG: hypothetical protein AAGF83_02415 [Cyanobacteria bacterium P01_G01_bin.67]
MKNKEFQELLRKNNSNSGFTLMELLIGLFMSIFVVGALGFGLMQVLRTTQSETSKVAARNETSRALDFISDEVKRASTIENDSTNATGFSLTAAKTVVLALNIPEVNTSATLGSDGDATTEERIVYFLRSATGTNWQGPLVLYRYGPPLDANGNYTNAAWQEEALIDGIDDTHITNDPCTAAGDVLSPPLLTGTAPTLTPPAISSSASGFHACINGGNTAQLYLTGGTDTATGGNDTYTSDTRVVARARTAPTDRVDSFVSYTMSFRTLGATYNCIPTGTPPPRWKMRTDFGNNPSNPNDTTSWIHQDNRQPQPIQIDTSNDLTITSVPVDPAATDCLSKGDENATGDAQTEPLSAYTDGTFPDGHTVPYTMRFVVEGDSTTDNNWHSFNGDNVAGTYDQPDVNGDGTILVLKNGSTISATMIGYDYNQDDVGDEDSLGAFLESKGYAQRSGDTYTIENLRNDERIMAVEVGQTDSTHPGFDAQDSVFILASDVFAQEY